MNYRKIYDDIIDSALNNVEIIECYTETHHIVPKSLGGTDAPDNLVPLTARQHFICHYLLTRIYNKHTFEWYKMNHAFMFMKSANTEQCRYFNSRLYEAKRNNFSDVMCQAQSGPRNSCFGRVWIFCTETGHSKKILKTELDKFLSNGWTKGRKVSFGPEYLETLKLRQTAKELEKDKIKSERLTRLQALGRTREWSDDQEIKMELELAERIHEAEQLFKKFIDSDCVSLRKFCREINYGKSVMTLSNYFRKYIPEYAEKSKVRIRYKK